MKIRVIANGATKEERLINRWGLSLLMDDDILFDTFGDPAVFASNIEKYRINIDKIKHIIISHDDWDHINGLLYLFDSLKGVNIYICPKFSGEIKNRIKSADNRVIELGSFSEIRNSVFSTGQLFGASEGRSIYEQSLVINTRNGLTVISGCAHPGIETIISSVKTKFNEDIYLLLGGFHLINKGNNEIKQIIEFLRKSGVRKVAPMHCTGKLAIESLAREYQNDCIAFDEGMVIEV